MIGQVRLYHSSRRASKMSGMHMTGSVKDTLSIILTRESLALAALACVRGFASLLLASVHQNYKDVFTDKLPLGFGLDCSHAKCQRASNLRTPTKSFVTFL